jgi:hypothetical protein
VGDFLGSFWQRVDVRGPDECWPWTGRTITNGYGGFGRTSAHRFAWGLANAAEVPPGKFVCHRCDVRLCVNPAHLWIGSHRENMKDATGKGRMVGGDFAPIDEPATPLGKAIMVAAKRLGSMRQFCVAVKMPRSTVYRLLRPSTKDASISTLIALRDLGGVELPPLQNLFRPPLADMLSAWAGARW